MRVVLPLPSLNSAIARIMSLWDFSPNPSRTEILLAFAAFLRSSITESGLLSFNSLTNLYALFGPNVGISVKTKTDSGISFKAHSN